MSQGLIGKKGWFSNSYSVTSTCTEAKKSPIQLPNSPAPAVSVYLNVDGVPVATAEGFTPGSGNSEFNMLPINTIQDLVAGQVVTIEAYFSTNCYFAAEPDHINIHFTGQALMLSEPTYDEN